MRKRLGLLASGLVSVVTLAACSSSTAPPSGTAPFEVAGPPVKTTRVDLPKSYRFDPAVIEISAGDRVTWTNHDNFPHNITLLDGSGTVKELPIGGSATMTFDRSGTLYYECSIHPSQMHGKIVVDG